MNSVGALNLIYSEAFYLSSLSDQKHFDKYPFFHLGTRFSSQFSEELLPLASWYNWH